ncbi:protein MpBromo2 [Marchantia polymorpha subsp. ruderalis]
MMEGPFVMSTGPAVGLKRKSMSLNGDVLKEAHSALVDVSLFSRDCYTREERKELRKKLRMHLEQVQGVTFKILARQEELTKVSCVVYPETQLSRTQNGGPLPKEIKLVPATMLDEPHRLLSQREARLARQPSVVVTSDAILGTPDAVSKDKRTPKANQLYVNSEFVSGKDKMPASEKPKGKAGIGSKRVGQVKVEACTMKKQKVDVGRGRRTADIMKLCAALARKLCNHKHSWVFNEPVDAVKLGLHDYHQVIKRPMDLGTIKKKVNRGEYTSPLNFAEDVRLTFSNAMTYNPQGHFVFAMAEQLRDIFEEKWKAILEKIEEDEHKSRVRPCQELLTPKPHVEEPVHPEEPEEKKPSEKVVDVQVVTKARPNGGKQAAQPKPKPSDLDKRLMNMEEKRKLSESLENLHPDKLERIVQIIKKRKPTLSHTDDEIEIDIDSLDNDTLWELERFVSNCMKSRGKVKKAALSQLVSASGSGPGSRARQLPPMVEVITENPSKASKGSEALDEDVEVADGSGAVASPTGVVDVKEEEKEKERDKEPSAGPVASSSSGSSSSDSGSASSSSDSDSASSSGSESEAEDIPRPPSAPKDVEATRDVTETVEEPVPAKPPVATQQDSREESQPERQVSPDKLLRAALLRGRFADTILKAQEKTLPHNKNEKLDPEKVRRDREELEKRQKEEKARLHAEAKAAEAARRKAEVEAAHEAKRKREAEREAARIQLQQMEKTVEIDENSEILKDLEMLRTASMDHLPSSGEDSPDSDSPDGLPDFALQGGNPLERLGLFMKNDDEDEDDEENNDASQANHNKVVIELSADVEEGEID